MVREGGGKVWCGEEKGEILLLLFLLLRRLPLPPLPLPQRPPLLTPLPLPLREGLYSFISSRLGLKSPWPVHPRSLLLFVMKGSSLPLPPLPLLLPPQLLPQLLLRPLLRTHDTDTTGTPTPSLDRTGVWGGTPTTPTLGAPTVTPETGKGGISGGGPLETTDTDPGRE